MKNISLKSISLRRIFAVLLAVVTACLSMSLPAFTPQTSAADIYNTTVKMYHWKRVKTQDDITTGMHYMMLVWYDSSYGYCFSGGTGTRYGYTASGYPYIAHGVDEFYTLSTYDTWHMYYNGDRDGDNGSAKRITIYNSENRGLYVDTDRNWLGIAEDANMYYSGSADKLTVTTYKQGGNYGNKTGKDKVQVLYNVSNGIDGEVCHSGYNLYMWPSDSYDYEDFEMYIAYEEEMTALGNYTVKKGSTLQIPHNTILKSDCTLTIEAGAVVSISGQFYNNGTIKNYGTLILDEGATLNSFDLRDEDGSGSIYCSGGSDTREGNLVVLENANIVLPNESAKIFLEEGATLNNFGLIVAPGGFNLTNSEFYCGSTGHIVTGYKITSGLSALKNLALCASPKSGTYNIFTSNYGVSKLSVSSQKTQLKNNCFVDYPQGAWISCGTELFTQKGTASTVTQY